jgi:uncharacterized protein (TIGR02466 family)
MRLPPVPRSYSVFDQRGSRLWFPVSVILLVVLSPSTAVASDAALTEDAQTWREYILEEELCLQDANGRLTECDFAGFSATELAELLKEVLENQVPPGLVTECTPGPEEVKHEKIRGSATEVSSQTKGTLAKVVDGMDVTIENTGMRLVFSTPIFMASLGPTTGRVNRQLKQLIKGLEEKAKRNPQHQIRKSAKGAGFRTGDDFLQMNHPVVRELHSHLMKFATHTWQFGRSKRYENARLELRGWANIMRPGAHHTIHVHPQSVWSGVYYVEVPNGTGDLNSPDTGKKWQDQSQGCLVLLDPRPGVKMTTVSNTDDQFVDKMEVCPNAGMAVMFPGWLSHYVPYIEGAGERIAISWNVHAVPT